MPPPWAAMSRLAATETTSSTGSQASDASAIAWSTISRSRLGRPGRISGDDASTWPVDVPSSAGRTPGGPTSTRSSLSSGVVTSGPIARSW